MIKRKKFLNLILTLTLLSQSIIILYALFGDLMDDHFVMRLVLIFNIILPILNGQLNWVNWLIKRSTSSLFFLNIILIMLSIVTIKQIQEMINIFRKKIVMVLMSILGSFIQ